ncbi:MAG: hydrogenase expression/formation protein HypE [Fervidicoccaceae archaeon]
MGRKVTLADGAGGLETGILIKELLNRAISLAGKWKDKGIIGLDVMDDAGFIKLDEGYFLAITVDSFTVNPPFFRGGSIGKLAADGTINDLIVSGAKPIAIVDAIVVEEGTEFELLKKAIDDMTEEALAAGVAIIGGDFKVMPKGEISNFIITTAGIGLTRIPITDDKIKVGDKIIVTGGIGEHGAVIAAHQFGLELNEEVKSDAAPLMPLLPILEKYGTHIHAARDPTRGGLAMVLNDWAEINDIGIIIYEEKIPIKRWVKAVSEVLGVDPQHLASEGRAVLAVSSDVAEGLLFDLKSGGFPEAEIIGEAVRGKGEVVLRTSIGGTRVIEPPTGIIVPRIC